MIQSFFVFFFSLLQIITCEHVHAVAGKPSDNNDIITPRTCARGKVIGHVVVVVVVVSTKITISRGLGT